MPQINSGGWVNALALPEHLLASHAAFDAQAGLQEAVNKAGITHHGQLQLVAPALMPIEDLYRFPHCVFHLFGLVEVGRFNAFFGFEAVARKALEGGNPQAFDLRRRHTNFDQRQA